MITSAILIMLSGFVNFLLLSVQPATSFVTYIGNAILFIRPIISYVDLIPFFDSGYLFALIGIGIAFDIALVFFALAFRVFHMVRGN